MTSNLPTLSQIKNIYIFKYNKNTFKNNVKIKNDLEGNEKSGYSWNEIGCWMNLMNVNKKFD